MGKYYEDRQRYDEALASFERAEQMLAKSQGAEHPYAVSAVVKQGMCNARLSRVEAACRAYERALEIMIRTATESHPMAKDIQAYLAANCR